MTPIFVSAIFIICYLLITLEGKLKVSKSAAALLAGSISWIAVGIASPHLVEEHIGEVGFEIFNITVFLLAAMSLVEILVHYRAFDAIRERIEAWKLSEVAQLGVISVIAFFLSAIIDNLTTTIIMIQIARRFFWGPNLAVAAVGIVIAANAGGAFSPIGDITTIMLWLADKFTALQIMGWAFLPAVAISVVSGALLSRKLSKESHVRDEVPVACKKLTTSEKAVISLVVVSFILPIVVKFAGLPPVFGLLLGLGITWAAIDALKARAAGETHMTASIEHLIQKADIASIKFFIGILLAVSALSALGVLETVSSVVYGSGGSTTAIVSGNILLGLISSFLDNIPLTAIAIDMLDVSSPALWSLLALAVGTGGSLLAVGSAAGVVATGMVKDLTFGRYFKIGFIPAFLGFVAGMIVWGVQYMLVF